MNRLKWVGWILVVWGCGCAPTLGRAYQEAQGAASRAFSAGRFEEAAVRYHEAASTAARARDRDEMLFLEATSYQRAGKVQKARAAFESLETLNPSGERAARAGYELAAMRRAAEGGAKDPTPFEVFLRKYPDSDIANRALLRLVAGLEQTAGSQAALSYLQKNMDWLKQSGLGEVALYSAADQTEKLGHVQTARDMFVTCADSYPYPKGALFDDSLVRASLLDEKLGDGALAVRHLQQMLAVRESSSLSGSYERPRFSEGQMRLAVLYRDALRDHAAARREFRRLFDSFGTSLLRDEALWEEAKLAVEDLETAEACDAMAKLVKTLPDSRYAPCARLLCPSAPVLDKPRACHGYIERSIGTVPREGSDVPGSSTR